MNTQLSATTGFAASAANFTTTGQGHSIHIQTPDPQALASIMKDAILIEVQEVIPVYEVASDPK